MTSEREIPLTSRTQALRAGSSDTSIRRQRRAGEIITVRRGTYAAAASVADLDREAKHRLLALAAADGRGAVVSHVSAAVLWGLPIWGADLSKMHVTKPTRSGGRITADRHAHVGHLGPDECAQQTGLALSSLARTLVDVGRTESRTTTLVAADHALHHRLVAPAELRDQLARMSGVPGTAGARRTLLAADGRSESPGESRTRLELDGVLPLESQIDVFDEVGGFVGRTDFGCEEAMLLIEFDGEVKYGTLLLPGQTPQDVFRAEKRRENALRELGYIVVRVSWSDLRNIPVLIARVERAYRRGLAMRARGQRPVGRYVPRPRIGI